MMTAGAVMTERIYLDHAATTPVLPEVWDAMGAVPDGNPASAHAAGRAARRALEDARELVAELLGAEPGEVIFTSGATEANNLALFGLAGDPPGHIVAGPTEHPCVAEPLNQLAARGFVVDYLPVGRDGIVDLAALPGMLRPDTRLVSVQLVNHETGAIYDLASGGHEPPESSGGSRPPLAEFHTDAAQAIGKIPVKFRALGATALTVSAHKFGGPPGVGALLLRRGISVRPLFHGGHQQQGRRPGTEPVALAVGMATALEMAIRDLEVNAAHVRRLRERFLTRLRSDAAPLTVNGDGVPHILNVSFPGCLSEGLLMALDLAGVSCSAGSACSSGSLLPSPVLRAMGLPEAELRSAVRFSFGPRTTEAEVDDASGRVAAVVKRLRRQQFEELAGV
jgi:cysteine desulfurase